MKKLLVAFLFLTSSFCIAQTSLDAKMLSSTKCWVIDSGSFPDNIVKLKAYNALRDSVHPFTSYVFSNKGIVALNLYSPPNIPLFRGNGTPYITKGSWTFKNPYVRLKVSGGYLASGTYSYDVVYKIQSFKDGSLILHKTKTYKNKKCETCIK